MSFESLVGRIVRLSVARLGPPGAWLFVPDKTARSDGPTVLLPRSEVPVGTREGDELEVFLYLDSADKPIATLRAPKLLLGQVAFLEATDVARFGAFFDWGLPKELLVPHKEQVGEVRVGERHPIGLYVDDSGRLAGTMCVSEMLEAASGFTRDQWVQGEAWRKEPGLGLFVIVERRCVGLLPEQEPQGLRRGEAAGFRIANVLPDGKIELSLRGHAHEELERDVELILETLARPGMPRVGDRSSPDQIRSLFGLSKKAFKRAVGQLLKKGAIRIDEAGYVVLEAPAPGRRDP